MRKVFISYRREDSQDVTGRIYDRLVEYFSADGVFKDVDNIPLGSDFRAVLDAAVGQAAAVLVVIGPTWASCIDQDGRRRLDSPSDFVRLEVKAALGKGVPVIPVLVGRARMPVSDELPDDLQPLAYRNGLSVRPDPDFNPDMERLAAALEQWVPRPPLAHRPTVNQALGDLAREREVERIDREWAEEREKYMVTVMKGQTFVDGRPTGGYPVREVPTRGGAIAGGIVAAVVGVVFAVVAGSIGWGFFAAACVIISLIGIGTSLHAFTKANEYEAAEAAYRQRRALALGKTGEKQSAVELNPNTPNQALQQTGHANNGPPSSSVNPA